MAGRPILTIDESRVAMKTPIATVINISHLLAFCSWRESIGCGPGAGGGVSTGSDSRPLSALTSCNSCSCDSRCLMVCFLFFVCLYKQLWQAAYKGKMPRTHITDNQFAYFSLLHDC